MTSPVTATSSPPVVLTGAGAPAAGATTSTSSSDPSQLSSQAFLKLIVAQLQYQDPTQPSDTTAFMNQTATLNQIEATGQMTAAMNLLLRNSLSQQATSLVGHTVSYVDSTGASQTGLVTGARLDGAAPTLHIGDTDVPLASVTGLTTAPNTTITNTTGSAVPTA